MGTTREEIDTMSHEEIKGKVQTQSLTNRVTVYHIPSEYIVKHFGPLNRSGEASECCINLVDVPGFADVGGEEKDL